MNAREDARKRIVNFYNDAAGGKLKSTVNYLVKQGNEKTNGIFHIATL